ncbi:hypothetical protein CA51_47610 [Rosistilla oblonga]|uniref:DUF1254 domain-containing protein n=1 Tax=Rosistilla oblonga TaxID=2527990 RepID=UPI00118970AC|nr:DUF1254 domain-containing protein [Rosistilla oblonga]QDV14851.1 hypothetical protein CA51_47610 [Rosistilla oblonga]
MKTTCIAFALFATAISAHAQELPTTGTLDSRLGKLEVERGFPSQDTVKKLYDAIDFQRACQTYLWALPYTSMGEWQREQRETFDAGNLDFVDYIDYKDKLGLLTANATTPYSMAFPNIEKTGPIVVEVPAGAMAGGILDFWERPLTDVGQTGPEKGAGAKFLILGPNDKEIVPAPEGYYVFRSQTNNVWVAMRGLDSDLNKARALCEKLTIYPYSERENPTHSEHIRPEGRPWTGEQPRGIKYWEMLAKLVNEEPPIERDRIMLATLVPLGIQKGKAFQPDARLKEILIDAANVGELMARCNGYAKRFPGSKVWPDKKWEYSLFLKAVNQEVPNYTELDERASWLYEAVGVSEGMMGKIHGAGQVYLESQKDANGEWLDGGKNYTLHVPADVPVKQFWSFTVYDNESRCLIDSGSYPDRSSRNDIVTNNDGTVDLYFGPEPPAGKPEKNWIKTLPGKGWFTYFRLYAPTEPYFDKSWVLPDIKVMK